MKTRFVLASLIATLMVLEVSAQERAEYDDMYFRGKDRERNKAIEVDESYTPARTKKQKEVETTTEEDNSNPTDSYSARNVNPEYVSRSNSEQASEDEENYYVEGYAPASSSDNFNYNNSYYNNANWARNSYYANSMWNSPYSYGQRYYDPWMNPYYGGGYYDPWMMGPSYGYPGSRWGSGWSISVGYTWGNNWGYPYYGGGWGNPYYGNYGYPIYYGEGSRPNYGKRPSRHSAVVTPSQRVTRTRPDNNNNSATVNNGRSRNTRQNQDVYYVRPSQRTSSSGFDNPTVRPSNSGGAGNGFSQPTRTRESYNPPSRTSSPSYTPSSSPSRSSSGSSGGGSSSPRPRGRN